MSQFDAHQIVYFVRSMQIDQIWPIFDLKTVPIGKPMKNMPDKLPSHQFPNG